MPVVDHVAVLGAGVMGRGIGQTLAQYGYRVTIRDDDEDVVGEARDRIVSGPYGLDRAVEGGHLTEDESRNALERISFTLDLEEAVDDADCVVEAVPEDLALKGRIFRDLDEVTDVPLYSNTSGFPITSIANAVSDPSRVAGTHFFNPVPVMNLVEIIATEQTDDDVVALAEALVDDVEKTSITIGDAPGSYGFVAARCFRALRREARQIVEEGIATEEQVDTALEEGYNFPAGPFARAGIGEEWD